MSSTPRGVAIAAHVIVGKRFEPYLPAMLAAVAEVCVHAVIHDNSGLTGSPNGAAIRSSRFAVEKRLTLVESPFVDFAAARNVCIDATPRSLGSAWALRIDADEVFDAALGSLAAALPKIDSRVDVIDGYSRHFIGSFDYYDEIARQLFLFRLDRGLRWTRPVHERLEGYKRRAVLPVVLFHYGHVVPPAVEQQRGELYSSLGQRPADESAKPAQTHSVVSMWGRLLRRAIPYTGEHPPAARPIMQSLRTTLDDDFREVDAIVAGQSPFDRARNALRAANYRRLLGWRSLEARLRWGWGLK